MRIHLRLLAVATAAAALGLPGTLPLPRATAAAASEFTRPLGLPGTPPQGAMPGGEPSLAFDPKGNGRAYLAAPRALANGTGGGVDFWSSADGGRSWHPQVVGSAAGGGDSDVEVTRDSKVYVADLEVASSAICRSSDFGRTFQDGCASATPTDQAGTASDREWVVGDPAPRDTPLLYFFYIDFATGFPMARSSSDSGRTWLPCGSLLGPAGPALPDFRANTRMAKPVIGPDGTIYILFAQATAPAGVTTPNLSALYLLRGKGGCGPGTVFTSQLVYRADPAVRLVTKFPQLAVDRTGALYAVASGRTSVTESHESVHLFTSRDGGTSWSRPRRVSPPGQDTYLPALAVGRPGTVAIGWYGDPTSQDPYNAPKGRWRYYAATSRDGTTTFVTSTVSPVLHYEGMDTRTLLDFSSMAVDPRTGCVVIAMPADSYERHPTAATAASVFVSRQLPAHCFGAGPAR